VGDRRATRGIGAGALLLVAALALGGCSLLQGYYGPVPTPSASKHAAAAIPTPTGPPPSPVPSPSLTPIAANTTVASGSVVSPKGSVRYSYRVVADGSNAFALVVTGFSSSLPVPVSAALAPGDPAIAVGDGFGTGRTGDAVLTAAGTSTTLTGVGHDPSGYTQLITYSSVDPSQAGVPVELGPQKVLAVTTVHWSVPVRASNVHPVDGGERVYAYGVVTVKRADGAPATYLVAHGDRAVVVAQRFGISLQDLLWLNPSMGTKTRLYEGTSINLDPNAL
jgi:hypothetical protein